MSDYLEIVQNGKFNRGAIQAIPEGAHLWSVDYFDKEANDCYSSVYYHSEAFLDHVKTTGRVAGYRGSVWTDCLVWDFDGEYDIGAVLVEVHRFMDHLFDDLNFKPENLKLYYSGSKGFHVLYVSPELEIFKKADMQPIVKKLCTTIAEGFKFFDTGIYDTTRIFRSINSKHPDTGRYKTEIPLIWDDIDAILEWAKTQQKSEEFEPNWEQDNTIIGHYKEMIELVVEIKKTGKVTALDIEDIITDGFTKGKANNQIVSLSGLLHGHGISDNFILAMLGIINDRSESPVPDSELRSRVDAISGYHVDSQWVKPEGSKIITMRQAGEQFVKVMNESGDFTFGPRYEHINNIMSLVLLGDLIGFVGSSGCYKSTNGMDLANSYAVEHDCASLFVSLEMAAHSCFFRGASITYTPDEEGDINSKELARRLVHEEGLREHIYKEWNNLHIIDGSFSIQQIEDYVMLGKEQIMKETGKKLLFVCMDYLQCVIGMTNIDKAADIARGMKDMVKRCGIYGLELLQTNKKIMDAFTRPTDQTIEGVQALKQSLDWLIMAHKSRDDKHRLHLEFNKTRWNNEGAPFDMMREGMRFHTEDFLADRNPNIL